MFKCETMGRVTLHTRFGRMEAVVRSITGTRIYCEYQEQLALVEYLDLNANERELFARLPASFN